MTDGPGPKAEHSPTVVIARAVLPGREREFRRWIRRLEKAAERAPGYVDAVYHEPNNTHPGEWLVVYRFRTQELLDAWLTSPGRQELIEESKAFVLGPPREQRLAVRDDDVVTMVSSALVRPGEEEAYRQLHADAVDACMMFDGFVRAELLSPVPGVQDETVAVFAFDSRENLQVWIDSDERRSILARMAPLHEGARTVNVFSGFAGWFGAPGTKAPKRWKQALTVLSALFPISLLITIIRSHVAPDLPLVPAVLVGNVTGIVLLTWVVMPFLTRVLAGWLSH